MKDDELLVRMTPGQARWVALVLRGDLARSSDEGVRLPPVHQEALDVIEMALSEARSIGS